MQTHIGKHGESRPTVAIDGSELKPHYHKQGLGHGYYVIVPTKEPENLDQLIADCHTFLKQSQRKAITKTVKKTKAKTSDDS
jgi:hypothetical protein